MKKTKIILFISLFFATTCLSASEGILLSLEKLLSAQKKQNQRLTAIIKSNRGIIKSLDGAKNLKLDNVFMRNILIYSDPKYLKLINDNECMFYALLGTNLLKTAEGPISSVLVSYEDIFAKRQTTIVTTDEFLQAIYKNKCQGNLELMAKFNPKNLSKIILSKNLAIPKSEKECKSTLEMWQSDISTPFLCNIPETILLGEKMEIALKHESLEEDKMVMYKKIINFKNTLVSSLNFGERTYLNNLCNNLFSSENFCSLYLQDDIWGQILKNDRPDYLIKYSCNRYIKNTKDAVNMLGSCREKMTKNPIGCAYSIDSKIPALYPRSKCTDISSALMTSHLKNNYQDCPGNIDNEGVTNTFRIIKHFSEDQDQKLNSGCNKDVMYTFATANMKQNWPLKICYTNRVINSKECLDYVPGDNEARKMSESSVVASILQKTMSAPNNLKCELIEKNKYIPTLLKYKSGCYIIYDERKCTSLNCPKEIKYNNRTITNLKYTGTQSFDYFSNNFTKSGDSISDILAKEYKIKPTILKNLTEINYFLGLDKTTIIHGVGCVENLLPEFFTKSSLNQCTPMPFIIDGMKIIDKESFVIFRAPIDDSHHPRIINWKNIFTAVASYRNLHPNKQWALYGLKK